MRHVPFRRGRPVCRPAFTALQRKGHGLLRQVQDQQLLIREFLDRVFDAFTSQPGIFHPAIRHVVGPKRRDFVGQHRADVKGMVGTENRIDVTGKNTGLEPIGGVIHHVEGLVEMLIPGEGDDRAKNFFAGNFHA